MRTAYFAALLMIGISASLVHAQSSPDLRARLSASASAAPTLRLVLINGDSIAGILRSVQDSAVVLERERISFNSIQIVEMRTITADPVLDKAVLGAVGGGLFGLIWPFFGNEDGARDSSTQLALSVVGFAAIGGGAAALIDSAFGRRTTWRQIWPAQ